MSKSAENPISTIGAVFESSQSAKQAAEVLSKDHGIGSSRVDVVEPDESLVESKLEPEIQSMAENSLRYTMIMAPVGLGLGVALAFAIVASGQVETFMSVLPESLFAGFAIGVASVGMFAKRPNRDPLVVGARAAAREGQWTVIVRPDSEKEVDLAKKQLEPQAEQLMVAA